MQNQPAWRKQAKKDETAKKRATEISTKVMYKLAKPKLFEILPSIQQLNWSGDFQIWAERFNSWSAKWNDEPKLKELINLL